MKVFESVGVDHRVGQLETDNLSVGLGNFGRVFSQQEKSNESIVAVPESVELPTAGAVTVQNGRHLLGFSDVVGQLSTIKVDHEVLVLSSHKTPP
jgi:hypothetical protein